MQLPSRLPSQSGNGCDWLTSPSPSPRQRETLHCNTATNTVVALPSPPQYKYHAQVRKLPEAQYVAREGSTELVIIQISAQEAHELTTTTTTTTHHQTSM